MARYSIQYESYILEGKSIPESLQAMADEAERKNPGCNQAWLMGHLAMQAAALERLTAQADPDKPAEEEA